MTNIDDEPTRLDLSVPQMRRLPLVGDKIPLPKPSPISSSFILALVQRRSAERFASISLTDLATWLYYVASVQSVHAVDSNRQKRFVGTFGALHPAHIMLGTPNSQWYIYLSGEHSLGRLCVNADAASELRKKAMQLFSAPDATLLALISDEDLVANYYKNASALILRDAGVLLGHAALVGAAVGVAFRILGITGSSVSERLVCGLPFKPRASGLALVGALPDALGIESSLLRRSE
jgi:hypothetical protein